MKQEKTKRESPLLNIGLNIVIPSVIMTKFSDEAHLGPVWGLVIALIFPLGYGLLDLRRSKKVNIFSALGLFSVLITGVIGLGGLDRNWMIAKETAIPLAFGIATLASELMGRSIIRAFFGQILDLTKIGKAFASCGHGNTFDKTLSLASYVMAGTFFVSAALNFILAIVVLKGVPGTAEFNQSLGKMTALSFPVITVPMMIMVGLILWYLFRDIKKKTNLDIEGLLR